MLQGVRSQIILILIPLLAIPQLIQHFLSEPEKKHLQTSGADWLLIDFEQSFNLPATSSGCNKRVYAQLKPI